MLALLGALSPWARANDPAQTQAQAPRTSPALDDLLRSPLDRPSFETWSWAAWTGEQREPVFALDLQAQDAEPSQDEVTPPAEGAPPVADPVEPPVVLETEVAPPTESEAAVESVVDASAPSPFADLDLGLFARSVAPVPPGIPESRVKARTSARATARAELAAALEGPDGEAWSAFLQEQLRYGQDAPTTWRGLADLVVEFELFELAPALATGLESDPAELVFQVSRHTLGELYGRDFTDLADFESFTEGLDLTPGTRRLLGELRTARAGSRARLLELLNYDRDAAVEHLVDADPVVRAGAASVLATALAAGEGEASALLPVLLDRLTVERWPNVAAVLLDAAGDALEARPAGDPMVERLRRGLADATGAPTTGVELLVATGLARLPWT
ncbi:MAG: hypothetical protein P1V81_15280, partial [Planctomycetota bacterium]|nr:hypothetical protein [Planctomycetota bacterium]